MKAEERMKLLNEALAKQTPESLAAKLRKYKAVGPVVPQSKFTAKYPPNQRLFFARKSTANMI